jgi:transposase
MVIFGVLMEQVEKRKELERHRRLGARLPAAGKSQLEIAHRVGVSRQTLMRWDRLRQQGGVQAPLRRAEHLGRPERLSESQREELVRLLKAGSLAAGFAVELWALPRIARVIEERFSVSMVLSSVWRLLGRLGWSVQRPSGQARERDERAIRTWKAQRWPTLKKSLRDKAE